MKVTDRSNKAHTLAYSIIGLQEMNLAYRFPTIYWDTACLIADSGGAEENSDDIDEDDDEEETTSSSKKKKATRYGKIAAAIGRMKQFGIEVAPPSINNSTYTFSPDESQNIIRYGLKGITKVGEDVVQRIIAARPFSSPEDFFSKVKLNKTQAINLIKSGAFDEFGDRTAIMRQFVASISDTKARLTLQNMAAILKYHILPPDFDDTIKVYNFNKYLKKSCKRGIRYYIADYPLEFFLKHFDQDWLEMDGATGIILISDWEKLYKKAMNPIRDYLKANQTAALRQLNDAVIDETYADNCVGTLSKWEMDSVSYYSHEHELAHVSPTYNVKDFNSLPEEPEVDRILTIKGREVPLLKLSRIAGTVLDKNKDKNSITLLTTTGVVTVKVWKNQFVKYDRQLSEIGADGKKHVIEKSWFSRGNKLFITGIRRDDVFIPKIYKNTGLESPFYLIDSVEEDGKVVGRGERVQA